MYILLRAISHHYACANIVFEKLILIGILPLYDTYQVNFSNGIGNKSKLYLFVLHLEFAIILLK